MGALRGGSRNAPGAGFPEEEWGGNKPKQMMKNFGVTILIKKFYFAQEAPCLNFHRACDWTPGGLPPSKKYRNLTTSAFA